MRIVIFLLCLFPLLVFGQGTTPGWTNFAFGTPSLKVRMPGTPKAQSSKIPAEVMSRIKTYEAFYLKDDQKGLVVTMMHADYSNGVLADYNGAAEGTNGQWQATGSKVILMSSTEKKISGRAALHQKGKLFMQGQEYDFEDIIVVEGSMLWQVIVMAKANDTSLKLTMQKIADSITL